MREIVALSCRTEGDVVETSDTFYSRDGVLVRADGFPPHPDRFARIGIELVSVLAPRLTNRVRPDDRARAPRLHHPAV